MAIYPPGIVANIMGIKSHIHGASCKEGIPYGFYTQGIRDLSVQEEKFKKDSKALIQGLHKERYKLTNSECLFLKTACT